MLTKILFTLVVIIVVALVYKTKTAKRPRVVQPVSQEGSLPVRFVAYAIIGVLILVSATIFFFKYQADNRIVNITVISEDGNSTVYQARQKDIRGRQFTTLDQRSVTLGESDRIEMDEQ